jgi:hypothetical protein
MISADQLLAHAVGDYVLQSDWMANQKTTRSLAALAHVLTYMLPFLLLTQNPLTLAVIGGTHFFIDRFRMARYVIWIRNYPWPGSKPWADCRKPDSRTVSPTSAWLLIIVDNIMHVGSTASPFPRQLTVRPQRRLHGAPGGSRLQSHPPL